MKNSIFSLTVCLLLINSALLANVITFDEFTDYTSETLHYGGVGTGATGFTSQGVFFPQENDDYSWSGCSYSKESDTATGAFTNQFSAITGQDVSGNGNYCVGAGALKWWDDYSTLPVSVSLDPGQTGTAKMVSGVYVTNTTYVASDMLDGSDFSKQFGGASGDDEDWFLLTITGKDAAGQAIADSVEFYLADYRFANNNEDYVVNTWQYVDLSSLGMVSTLEFYLSSSDTGTYGMNTPAYFAMDNLTYVPEPLTIALFGFGALVIRRRK
ncbi:MAG: DUF4465 domain-containing protein [Planctomycetota bacterium]